MIFLFYPTCSHAKIIEKSYFDKRWRRSEISDTLECYKFEVTENICSMCRKSSSEIGQLERDENGDINRQELIRYKYIIDNLLIT